LWGAEDGDSEDEPHEEAANVGKVVEARKEADYKADNDVKHEKEKFLHRRGALRPVPDKVEEEEGDNAKKGAGTTGR
jgi:hypothetical protein